MKQYYDAWMYKDFRLAYQREHRFLWTHLEGQEASGFNYLDLSLLDYIDLDLGPLDDIAKISPLPNEGTKR